MACPDDNLLVALDALDPAQFAEIELHIDTCEHCRKIVAAAVAEKTLAVGTPAPAEEDALAQIVDVAISDRYVIESVLGRGGMGTVFLARDRTLHRHVALKVHRAGSGPEVDPNAPPGDVRLHREALAMAKLSHPNVVTVFEVGSVDDRMYVAMEYVRGETLRGWLASCTRSWREIVELLLQAGEGLAAAHAAGLVHRDFKPENVLVGEDGRARVSDFGLARIGTGRDAKPAGGIATDVTQTGTILGTPAYMAPEQLAGDPVDARCDQFAFCVVAWEALFGRRPFAGTTLAAIEEAIHRQQLPSTGGSEVPQRVRDVIARGLAVKPSDRYGDMPALLAALRAAAAPRTKKYLAVAVAGTVLVGGVAFAASSMLEARRQQAACEEAENAMLRPFDARTRFAMQAAFTATGVPSAAISFDRAAKVLGDYSERLAARAREACTRRDEPVSLAEARRACLADRQAELSALVDVMREPDASIVQRAPSAAWAIYDPAPCSDPSMLLAGPLGPSKHSPADAERLTRVRALEDAGQYREAIALATPLLEEARAKQDRRFELAALMSLAGASLQVAEDPRTVLPLLHEAVQLAETLGRDLDAAGVLSLLANTSAVELQDFQSAHRYIALARAKLERLGNGNLGVRGELFVTEAQVFLDENRLGEAQQAMERAVEALEQAYGPHHPKLGSAFGSLSQILRARNQDSLAASERAMQIFRDAYGPEHPTSAGAEMNLAQALMRARRYPEAREHLQRASAVFANVFGDMHPLRAAIAGNLAEIHEAEGNYDAALGALGEAVAILEAVQGPDSADVSGARRDVARVHALAGRLPDAIAEMERALAILDKLGSDGESRIVSALTEIADYHLAANQPALALPYAERALAIGERRPADANPHELGYAKFVLARALWDAQRDRRRARELAMAANELVSQPRTRVAVQTWLAEHPAAR